MPASLLIDLFSGDFYVWWLSSAKEVLFGMLAYVSKIFAVVQFNKEEFPVISSVSHIRDQARVFITKTWGGEKHLSAPSPPPTLSRFLSPSAYFRVGGWRKKKRADHRRRGEALRSLPLTHNWENVLKALQEASVPCHHLTICVIPPNCHQVLENYLGSGLHISLHISLWP